ncbi:N-acetylmuramoyl-L-alanine amidase [Halosquirtibacter laminarini]|uniref:N-acetylmuramoyl-L-alanine amidase n=1 Tax=Halosquirtibacter laminarini TaxID=3374600 RepID=A0AC61NC19_9BACT|nr:N-acetylmuramoyl-L-alanine amidase [Prolixibacteraceae bacterium]
MTRIKTYIFLFTILFTTRLQAQNKYVIAQKGDGIIKLLQRNNLSPSKYRTAFIEINKNQIGKNDQLYAGVKYKLPDVKTNKEETKVKTTDKSKYPVRKYKIFGSTYDTIHITNNQLKSCVFYLVSGHGGPDPGAIEMIDNKMITEDEYAYDVTLRLGRELIRHGARVYIITRDNKDGVRDEKFLENNYSERCYPNKKIPLNQKKRLRQRTNIVNKLYKQNKKYKYQRLLVLHVDAFHPTKSIDLYFYHHKRSKTGRQLANNMKEVIRRKYDQYQPHRGYNGTVTYRDLHMISMTDPPTVFIELGNIKNSRDQQRLMQPNNRQLLAEWMTQGIIKDKLSKQR